MQLTKRAKVKFIKFATCELGVTTFVGIVLDDKWDEFITLDDH
jgi:hypothetical protein